MSAIHPSSSTDVLGVFLCATFLLIVGYNVYHYLLRRWYWHRYLPYLVRQRQRRGDNQGALRLMERALKRYDPENSPAVARHIQHIYALALHQSGQYSEALLYLRPLREHYTGQRRNQALLHINMASSLTALGRASSAGEERQIALNTLASSGDYESRLLSGRLLCQEKRYAEACIAFEEGVQTLPKNRIHLAAGYFVEYAYCLYYTHCFTESQDIARQAIRLGETGARLTQAHWIIAIAAQSAGNRSSARREFRETLALAKKYDQPAYLAGCYFQGAMLAALDGDVADMRHCLEEAERTEMKRIDILALKGSLLHLWTDSPEAQAAMAEAEALLEQESGENRRVRERWLALIRMWFFARKHQPEDALAALDAYEALTGEDAQNDSALRLSLSPQENEALHLWKDALRSSTASQEGIRQRIESLASALSASPPSRGRNNIYVTLVWSSLHCGFYDLALRFSDEYRAAISDAPVLMPTYYYSVGECLAGMGRLDGARDAWQQALAIGQDTWDARRASARLADMSAT